ncbi:hypothetical protein Tco_0077133 [Tanacetum coccineum]
MYHAFMESLIANEDAMDQGVADLIKHKKRSHDDEDRDQDPPAGPNQGLKKRKTSKDAKLAKKSKLTGSSKDTTQTCKASQGKSLDNEPKQTWLNDLANAKNSPLTFNDLMITLIDFSAFAMNRLKISKLIKAYLVGPVYNLLKGTCKSYVELEYNMKECYHALSDQLDWNNPEGNRCPYDLNKPLPLHESRGHLTVPADFFFNNDLEYLRGGSNDKNYTTSTTKTKAVKYEIEGIKDMVPNLWSLIKGVRHDVYSTMMILSVTSVTADKWYGYGHLKEIVVRRADQKLYKFIEGDFLRLHLNDIEDMLLLVVQNRLNNLEGDIIVDLAVALYIYMRRIVIQKRVEDL